MRHFPFRSAALALGMSLSAAGLAQAQYYGANPAQYYSNIQAANAARFTNPYAYGYGYGAGYGGVAPIAPGAGAYGSPYGGVNPYTPVVPSVNPYTPIAPGGVDPYAAGLGNPYVNPYAYGAGNVLYGQAEVIRAYGTVINDTERARVLREQALQAQIETKKRKFEYEMWVRANTPTYTEEQNKIAKSVLLRIQTNSTPAEVVNGKALNILLDDLRKFPSKKANMEPIQLAEDILKQVNVTKTNGSVGVLRGDGRFNWPAGIQEIISKDRQKSLQDRAIQLVQGASVGKIDNLLLTDFEKEIRDIREMLIRKMNDLPTIQYLEARRFLNDFEESLTALRRGEVQTQAAFQRFVAGGKTIQDIVDYMIANGLRFGPATAMDEGSYRALHSALAAFDVTLNAQLGNYERKDQ